MLIGETLQLSFPKDLCFLIMCKLKWDNPRIINDLLSSKCNCNTDSCRVIIMALKWHQEPSSLL